MEIFSHTSFRVGTLAKNPRTPATSRVCMAVHNSTYFKPLVGLKYVSTNVLRTMSGGIGQIGPHSWVVSACEVPDLLWQWTRALPPPWGGVRLHLVKSFDCVLNMGSHA